MQINWKRLLRNFAIELGIYGILVVAYFLVVLRILGEPLTKLFHQCLEVYAILALLLIIGQGVILEAITSFLVERLGLERME
ncbi:MAG: hypothetical protein JXA78_14815 [Anaerolineales bacterium]|nr:hypothetical protein [Anaerolineales bacterium]